MANCSSNHLPATAFCSKTLESHSPLSLRRRGERIIVLSHPVACAWCEGQVQMDAIHLWRQRSHPVLPGLKGPLPAALLISSGSPSRQAPAASLRLGLSTQLPNYIGRIILVKCSVVSPPLSHAKFPAVFQVLWRLICGPKLCWEIQKDTRVPAQGAEHGYARPSGRDCRALAPVRPALDHPLSEMKFLFKGRPTTSHRVT